MQKKQQINERKKTNISSVMEDSMNNRDNISFVGEVLHAKHSLHLLKNNKNCCSSHESSNCGSGQKIYQKTKPAETSQSNFIHNPSYIHTIKTTHLKIPMAVWKTPVKKAAVKKRFIYSFVSLAGSTACWIIDCSNNDAAPTVPIATFFELPKTA